MKNILMISIFCLSVLSCGSTIETKKPAADMERLKHFSNEAKTFCRSNNLNNSFYILIDLKMHSGLNRFFIWDFERDTVINSFPVSHGCCKNPWGTDWTKEKALTSNNDGSHCSSVGKYKIGERGYSNWGINVKYLLHGLDLSNSNALKRDIVFHSWEKVPDAEIFPNGTPEGWGCPAISNENMRIVDKKLKNANKNVLMWVIQ